MMAQGCKYTMVWETMLCKSGTQGNHAIFFSYIGMEIKEMVLLQSFLFHFSIEA